MGMILIPSVSRTLFRILAILSWIACVFEIVGLHSPVAGLLAALFTALLVASGWPLRILHARPAFIPL